MNWAGERVHVVWQVLALACGILLGAWLGIMVNWRWAAASFNNTGASLIVIGMALFALVGWRSYRYLVPVALFGGMLIGGGRGLISQGQLVVWRTVVKRVAVVQGVVATDPDQQSEQTSLTLTEARLRGRRVAGRVYVGLPVNTIVRRGDLIEVKGHAFQGFGAYAASIKGNLNWRQEPKWSLVKLRDQFSDRLKQLFSPDEAALAAGILLGEQADLSGELKSAFVIAALTHILVASGYNLTIIVRFARRLFAERRLLSLLLAGGLIILFDLLAGLNASLWRASLVAGLSLLAWYVGRRFHPAVILALVAAMTVLVGPWQLQDIGWQLSFLSFGGVLLLAPLVNAVFKEVIGRYRKWAQSLSQVVVETLCAQAVTLPVILYLTNILPLMGLVSNILVVPLIPLAMLLAFAAGVAGCILPLAIARCLAWPAHCLLSWVISVTDWCASLGGQIHFKMDLLLSVAFYVGLVALGAYLKYLTKHNYFTDNIVQ